MPAAKVRRLISFVVPEGVLLLAAVIVVRLPALHGALPAVASIFPYAVFAIGALLAARFQRSRLLFALIILALATLGLEAPDGRTFDAIAVLLPLNLAALTLLLERGTLTPFGLTRLGVIGFEVICVALLRRATSPHAAVWLSHAVLPPRWFLWTPLPQPALAAFVLAVALAALPLVLAPNTTARPFLWAIAAAFLALNAHHPGAREPGQPVVAVYLGTAGLILVVAAIEASYLLAYQDSLTELPARRALSEALERLTGQYSIAMVDVDHFKKFNDDYGHDVGDQVLRMVAAKLLSVEAGGRVYRYGGEEFAILFPGRTLEEALPPLEAVRKAVAANAFTIRGRIRPRKKPDAPKGRRRRRQAVAITISIGAAERGARHGSPGQVLEAADRALYVAKQEGRNRLRS